MELTKEEMKLCCQAFIHTIATYKVDEVDSIGLELHEKLHHLHTKFQTYLKGGES